MLFADLHIHSKYSRAVSPDMDLLHLAHGARLKGLQILGTGDFTHPLWLEELKNGLRESEGNTGLFHYGDNRSVLFMLTAEVATFHSTPKGVKKVHHCLHAPSFEVAEQLNDVFSRMGSLKADGRPMFGRTSCVELMQKVRGVCKEIVLIPAHAWTPYFGVFGSKSGFNSLEEAFEDQAQHVFAIETGLSSDPEMNWRCSFLDRVALVSNSDSHSPTSWRLCRECNAFSFDLSNVSFGKLFDAVRQKDAGKFLFTVEVDPAYGKYHFDGHRVCNFSCMPSESTELKNNCPVCKRELTIGVLNRVEELADRPVGFKLKNAIPFKRLLPLHELLSALYGVQLYSKKAMLIADKLISHFGSELNVLLDADAAELSKVAGEDVAKVIALNRANEIKIKPGYDGEYGVPLFGDGKEGQKRLGEF